MPGSKLMRPFSSSFTWASSSLILACSFAGSEVSVFMADSGSGSGPWRGTREERPAIGRWSQNGRRRRRPPVAWDRPKGHVSEIVNSLQHHGDGAKRFLFSAPPPQGARYTVEH